MTQNSSLNYIHFQSGLKAVHIPPLDPFVLDNTPINFNQGNAVQVNGFIKARLRGFKHCQLKSVK